MGGSLELGEHVIVDMVQIRPIVWLLELLLNACLKLAKVLRVEELEFVGDLMHVALLLERERLALP